MTVEQFISHVEGMISSGQIEKSSQVRLDLYGRGGVYVVPLLQNRLYADATNNLHIDSVDV